MPSTVSWPDWRQQAGRGGDWIRATLINYLPANLLFFTCEIKPSSGEPMPLQDNAIERSLCPAMALSQVKMFPKEKKQKTLKSFLAAPRDSDSLSALRIYQGTAGRLC